VRDFTTRGNAIVGKPGEGTRFLLYAVTKTHPPFDAPLAFRRYNARACACVRAPPRKRTQRNHARTLARRTSIRLRESPDSGSAVILTTWQPLCRPHACKLRMKSVRQRGTEARRKKKRAGSLSSSLPLPLACLSSRGLHISRGRYEREEFHRARSNVARRE